jgi:hypothetical protein
MTLPPPLHFDLLKHSNSVGRTQIELFAVAFGPGRTILPTKISRLKDILLHRNQNIWIHRTPHVGKAYRISFRPDTESLVCILSY